MMNARGGYRDWGVDHHQGDEGCVVNCEGDEGGNDIYSKGRFAESDGGGYRPLRNETPASCRCDGCATRQNSGRGFPGNLPVVAWPSRHITGASTHPAPAGGRSPDPGPPGLDPGPPGYSHRLRAPPHDAVSVRGGAFRRHARDGPELRLRNGQLDPSPVGRSGLQVHPGLPARRGRAAPDGHLGRPPPSPSPATTHSWRASWRSTSASPTTTS